MHFCQPEISFEPWVQALVWISLFKTKNDAPAPRCGTVNGKTHVLYLSRFLMIRHDRKYLLKEIDL
jgi:hypothetical protein